MDLKFVKETGCEHELRDRGPVDEHFLLARGSCGLGHCGSEVVDVGDQRPLARVDAGFLAAVDPDRHAVVVVTAPAARRLEGPPTSDDCAGAHHFCEDGAVGAGEMVDVPASLIRVGIGEGPIGGEQNLESDRSVVAQRPEGSSNL